MRRHRRLWIGVLGVALVGSAVLAWWLCQRGPGGIDPWTWRDIDQGIALAEVEELIGAPPGIHNGREPDAYTAWIWQSDARPVQPGAGRRSVELRHIFKNLASDAPRPPLAPARVARVARVARPGDRIVTWTGPQYAIAVQLDAEDRVVATCLAALHAEDMRDDIWGSHWWDPLLDWLGIP
jgi:hypothetical protein